MNTAERTTRSIKPNGPRGTAAWLAGRGLSVPPHAQWRVMIVLDDDPVAPTTELYIVIDRAEWGVRLVRADGVSWIRVSDSPHVCERDDFGLLGKVPRLRDLSRLVEAVEEQFGIRFRKQYPTILSNLPKSETKIRLWVVAAL